MRTDTTTFTPRKAIELLASHKDAFHRCCEQRERERRALEVEGREDRRSQWEHWEAMVKSHRQAVADLTPDIASKVILDEPAPSTERIQMALKLVWCNDNGDVIGAGHYIATLRPSFVFTVNVTFADVTPRKPGERRRPRLNRENDELDTAATELTLWTNELYDWCPACKRYYRVNLLKCPFCGGKP